MITTIISGGQTGADRAALDVALAWGIPVRGYVPQGRVAEDGVIPERYPNLVETETDDPAERTRLNVRDADGALMIAHGELGGGSLLAADTAARLDRPVLHVDLTTMSMDDAVHTAAGWVRTHNIHVLGVGGPRASEDTEVYAATTTLLNGLLRTLAKQE